MSDTGWRQSGNCVGVDPEVFFRLDPTEAQEVCQPCPVKTQCLQWALDHHPVWGIWAGTTETQRAKRRRNHAQQARRAA